MFIFSVPHYGKTLSFTSYLCWWTAMGKRKRRSDKCLNSFFFIGIVFVKYDATANHSNRIKAGVTLEKISFENISVQEQTYFLSVLKVPVNFLFYFLFSI